MYSIASYPAGLLADKYGFKKIYIFGILIFAGVYGIFGTGDLDIFTLFIIFAIYGLFSAIDDGTTKAWLSLHIEKDQKATGLGLYMLLTSFGFFFASIITGLLWRYAGGAITFSILSILSLGVLIYFLILKDQDIHTPISKSSEKDLDEPGFMEKVVTINHYGR
jgi:MFS family permease